ncbi:MAG: small, acid-soluble spore protein, alpha/beta type [Clostridium sp.]|nr:small, acid-soluble spore protein, alpha/beta type [Clostridium sp.]
MENLDEKIKNEIITELGLFDRIKKHGWKSLTAKETGRIGGLITKRKKMMQAQMQKNAN